jgi:hypothetical protein
MIENVSKNRKPELPHRNTCHEFVNEDFARDMSRHDKTDSDHLKPTVQMRRDFNGHNCLQENNFPIDSGVVKLSKGLNSRPVFILNFN